MSTSRSRLDNRPARAADGAGEFFVPDKPVCTITVNGNDADWLACGVPAAQSFNLGAGTPFVTARMYLTHAQPPNKDILHVYFAISDPTNNPAGDLIVLMLDTGHTHADKTDDRGLCFRRNFTVDLIVTTPTGACTANAFPGLDNATLSNCPVGARGCMISSAAGMQWTVEVNLVPDDFGLTSFGGTVGMMVRAVNGAATPTFNVGPNTPDENDPSTWANLTLGHALDVVLVLDLSGSMGSLACPTCSSKLDYLKQAVVRFIQDFSAFAWQADRISVAYFNTNVTAFPAPGPLVSFDDNKGAIITSVQGTSAGGATAMGGGLQTGINLFADPTNRNPGRSRHIVLFSDGMQNVNPMVFDDGTGAWRIDDQPGHQASGVAVTTPRTVLDGSIYKIHTLGIDATDPFLADMNSIAAKTGGTPENNPDGTKTAQMFVNAAISTMSSHGSPQLVALRRDTLASDSVSEVFTVNRGVKRVLLEAIWLDGRELSVQVRKDGKDVTASMQTLTGAAYRGFFVDPPFQVGGEEVAAEGQWEMQIMGQPGTMYEVAALVDEPALKFEVGTDKPDYLLGQAIPLTAEVTYGGAPVDDATVTVVVGKPGQGTGVLLSVNSVPAGTPTVPPESQASPAQVKLQRLLEDQRHWKAIQQVDRTVELKSQGGGKYTGTLGGTDVVGAYSLTFVIAGTHSELGTYRRTRTLSTMVRLGPGDPDDSRLEIRTLQQMATERKALLTFRPAVGKVPLGPDFGSRIHVVLDSGSVEAEPRDLLDGRYEVVLLLPPNGDPGISIKVENDVLFKGKVSDLERRLFALSLHVGVSLPLDNFNTTHNPGFGITADAEYWWNRSFAVAALLGYHRFPGEAANPDLDLFHGSLALEARLISGSPTVLLDAGAGFYHFDPGSTDLGIHGGVGIEFPVSPTVSLGVTGRVYTVFTTGSNTTFSSLQAGGRVWF